MWAIKLSKYDIQEGSCGVDIRDYTPVQYLKNIGLEMVHSDWLTLIIGPLQ